MMNDRELLEMAAKAAGYDTKHSMNAERLELDPPVDSLLIRDADGHLLHTAWNPLTDDGDALRLAVKLRIIIDVTPWATDSYFWNARQSADYGIRHTDFEDPCAATRRAIVRAAAAIGSQLP